MLRRSWGKIVCVSLLVTGLVTVLVLRTPRVFEAESRLLVRLGREYVYRPEVGSSDSPRAPSLAEMVNSEVEILSSRDLAEQVVRSIGVQELYPQLLDEESDPERATALAVLRFRQAASIRSVLESSVIKVSLEHPEPTLAAQGVNLLVERFRDKHLEVFGEERANALQLQLAQREAELVQAEEALADFKSSVGVFDLDEQRSLLLGRVAATRQELDAYALELTELSLLPVPDDFVPGPVELPPDLALGMRETLVDQRYQLERELRALEPQLSDELVRDASLRLLDLELEQTELLRDYSADSRKVQSVHDEIERVRRFLAESERKAGSTAEVRRQERGARATALAKDIADLDEEIRLLVRAERQGQYLQAVERQCAIEVRCTDLRRTQEQLEAELRVMDGHEKTLGQLERGMAGAEAALQGCRERVDDARFREALDREKQISVRVIERAVPPVVPRGLSRKLMLALGVLVGLLSGVGWALLTDVFRAR